MRPSPIAEALLVSNTFMSSITYPNKHGGLSIPEFNGQEHVRRDPSASTSLRHTRSQTALPPVLGRKVMFVRALTLICACSLSVGAHYASYILGPLKTRLSRELGASNTEFSLLIAAFSLNSTWTPLLGGLITTRLGTTTTSIIATGVIFLGQLLLLIGNSYDDLRIMAFGMFVFGLGVSPLAVVQESIIVRFFKDYNLGLSMAIGLVAGKGASFLSASTSYILAERYGRQAPFYVATGLALYSVVVNLIYISASKWILKETGTELEASELEREARRRSTFDALEAEALERIAKKRRVSLRDILDMDDNFWTYVFLNVLCGMIWQPFTHLAANLLEIRYSLSESQAARQASLLLAGSIFLYPLSGFIIDKSSTGSIVVKLFLLSSLLQLFCYIWLSIPPTWTHTALPGVISFAAGVGFSPLLLVVIVPQLVDTKFISTTLGVHKSLEQTGSVIAQTLAGLVLDQAKHHVLEDPSASRRNGSQLIVTALAALNVIQFGVLLVIRKLDQERRDLTVKTALVPEAEHTTEESIDDWPISRRRSIDSRGLARHETDESRPLIPPRQSIASSVSSASSQDDTSAVDEDDAPATPKTRRRGYAYFVFFSCLILFAWTLFLVTAWIRLRSKGSR